MYQNRGWVTDHRVGEASNMMSSEQPSPSLNASHVPDLRRELAEWYGGPQGAQYYYNAIVLGRQAIKPAGTPERVARQLATAEATRLRDGDLWYVDEDLCALVAAAHPSMPAFAPRPSDLPSRVGFVVFANPIALYAAAEARHDSVIEQLAKTGGDNFLRTSEKIHSGENRIVAVSWGPNVDAASSAGGLWMSFYAPSAVHFGDVFEGEPEAERRARSMLPRLNVDNEACLAWRPDGAPPDRYRLPAGDERPTTLTWARLVFAAFQLAAQKNLAETGAQSLSRTDQRRNKRAGLPDRDVRIVRLRRSLSADRDAENPSARREWRHRWVVRGHWRNHWYPSIHDHRPMWIAPYLKGPTDAPLLGGDKVIVIDAPAEHDDKKSDEPPSVP
jgi:hypothetical protein